jgi:hypothetical protein
MNKVLLFGCGSKWGSYFTKNLADNGYTVDLITSTGLEYPNVYNYKIDWFTSSEDYVNNLLEPLTLKKYNLIFFNQNTGGGPNDQAFAPGHEFPVNQWNMHNLVNSQLPFVAIKKLSNSIHDNTKIGWMLTGLIDSRDSELWRYAGYASVKSANLHIMRGFSKYHHGIFFALNPIWFPAGQEEQDANDIRLLIENLKSEDNGCTVDKNGKRWI